MPPMESACFSPFLGHVATVSFKTLTAEGRNLYWWHPLVSLDPETVHQAGVSVQNKTIPEDGMDAEDYEDHIVYWPGYAYISDK